MRHLISLLAGVVAAPLTWLLLSTGQHRSQRVVEVWDQSGRFDTVDLITPAAFLAIAGIMLGLLGTLRWSPAGPIAAGILFVIPTGLMFINPFRTLDGFLRPDDGASRRFLAQDLQPWLPVENGTLLVLGILLLMAVFSVHRWRRWPVLPAPIPAATDAEVVAGISALSTSPPAEQPAEESAESAEERRTGAMTDEEILASAAAYQAEESARTGESPTAAEEAAAESSTRDPDEPERAIDSSRPNAEERSA